VNQHIKKLFLPYTVIDVGYWYQLSCPRLPSGRFDYATFPGMNASLHGDGEALNILTDLRDVGHFVARIVYDERTLNKSVFCWGDVLSENQVYEILEEVSGEKLERHYVCSSRCNGLYSC
jgi:NmrA-like family protein